MRTVLQSGESQIILFLLSLTTKEFVLRELEYDASEH